MIHDAISINMKSSLLARERRQMVSVSILVLRPRVNMSDDWTISLKQNNVTRNTAVYLRAMGDSANEIWNRVQKYQAESSVDLPHPVLSKMLRKWFFTVSSEMNSLSAISFFVAPQAISSVISLSRVVRFVFIVLFSPYFSDTIFVENFHD